MPSLSSVPHPVPECDLHTACRARVGTYSSPAHKEEEGTDEYKKYKKYTLLKNNVETKSYVSPWETWENSSSHTVPPVVYHTAPSLGAPVRSSSGRSYYDNISFCKDREPADLWGISLGARDSR